MAQEQDYDLKTKTITEECSIQIETHRTNMNESPRLLRQIPQSVKI